MNIIKPSAKIHSKPIKTSTLETECLFGEFVEIIDQYNSWVFCKLETDNYCGWIQKKNLGNLRKPTHRVLSLRTSIYKKRYKIKLYTLLIHGITFMCKKT